MKVFMPYSLQRLKDYMFKENARNFIFIGVHFQIGIVPLLQT